MCFRWRHKADSDKAGGGWQGYSGPTDVHTLKMTRPVELLKSRIPRIFLLQEIGFKSNSDHITAGMDSLPEVHRLLQEYVRQRLAHDTGCCAALYKER